MVVEMWQPDCAQKSQSVSDYGERINRFCNKVGSIGKFIDSFSIRTIALDYYVKAQGGFGIWKFDSKTLLYT